jgi:sulfite dehydrogenase (cytochrome) subunit A
MAKAYKIPATPNGDEDPHAKPTDHLIPINRMNVRSFVTAPEPGSTVPAGRAIEVEGIAFDGGSGIRGVEVSSDGGSTWAGAVLGDDLGRYSFRRWRYRWAPASRGEHRLRSRATAGDGSAQPDKEGWNRGGYMRNVVEEMAIHVV